MTSSFRSTAVVGAGAVGSFFGAMLARAGHRGHADRPRRRTCRRSSATGLRLEMGGRVEAIRAAAQRRPRRGARRRPGALLRQVDRHRSGRARDGAAPRRRRARPQPAERRRERGDDRPPRAPGGRSGGRLRRDGDARARPRPAPRPRRSRHRRARCARRRSDAALAARAAGAGRLVRDRAGAGAHLGRRDGRAVVEADGELRLQRDLRARAGEPTASWPRSARCASCSERWCRGRRARRGRRRRTCRSRPRSRRWSASPRAMPAQLSSTAQDMARGKPSEIDHLNGFVARRGAELGVATPANQALHALVKLVESDGA